MPCKCNNCRNKFTCKGCNLHTRAEGSQNLTLINTTVNSGTYGIARICKTCFYKYVFMNEVSGARNPCGYCGERYYAAFLVEDRNVSPLKFVSAICGACFDSQEHLKPLPTPKKKTKKLEEE